MLVIVCYDVNTLEKAGQRRLRRLAEACKNFGVRVQYSVFECRIEEREWVVLRSRLLSEYDCKLDSLRFYFVGEDAARKTEHHGLRAPTDPTGVLIV